jgi:acetolactate synthase-1/2/3 large subunit
LKLVLINLTFCKHAESYGATGHRITAADDLVPTFETVSEAGACASDLPVNYSENQKVLIDELAAKARLL